MAIPTASTVIVSGADDAASSAKPRNLGLMKVSETTSVGLRRARSFDYAASLATLVMTICTVIPKRKSVPS